MLTVNNRLAGYTLLRKRNAYVNNKFFTYYYFDSFVLHKEFRNKGLGKKLILFNNKVLNQRIKLVKNQELVKVVQHEVDRCHVVGM